MADLGNASANARADTFSLKGKVAVVSGAAGGIGSAAAQCLRAAGARLILCDRDADGLDRTATGSLGPGIDLVPADLTLPSDVSRIAAVAESAGGADIVINCVGVQRRRSILEVGMGDLEDLWKVNVGGVFGLTQRLLPQCIAKGYGKIINLCSIGSFVGLDQKTVYAMTKGAVAQYTRSLAVEVARYGIRVNGIAPGYVETPMTHAWLNEDLERRDGFLRRIPLGRFATPDDLTGLVIYLAAPASDYMTGQVVVLDGGWTIW